MKASTTLFTAGRTTFDCLPLPLRSSRTLLHSRVFPATILYVLQLVHTSTTGPGTKNCGVKPSAPYRVESLSLSETTYSAVHNAKTDATTSSTTPRPAEKPLFLQRLHVANAINTRVPRVCPHHESPIPPPIPHSSRTRLVQIRRNPLHHHGSRPTCLHQKNAQLHRKVGAITCRNASLTRCTGCKDKLIRGRALHTELSNTEYNLRIVCVSC